MTINRITTFSALTLLLTAGACTVQTTAGNNGDGGDGGEAPSSAGESSSGGSTSSGGSGTSGNTSTAGTDAGDSGSGATGGVDTGGGGDAAGGSETGGTEPSGGQPQAGETGEGGASEPATPDDGMLGVDDFEFPVSNLSEDLSLAADEDLILDGDTCGTTAVFDTDEGVIRCNSAGDTPPAYSFSFDEQSDGTDVAVFAASNIEIDTALEVTVEGSRPLVLLASGEITVRGFIEVTPGTTGGFPGAGQGAAGLGPGGGGPYASGIQAGGGGFCGPGGAGAGSTGEGGGAPGDSWGSQQIVPLIGGSSGGSSGGSLGRGGHGGGAIQFVAGASINITLTGVISAPGGAGQYETCCGGGGGAGGAILLEAPEVIVAGTLAANGGGGGAGDAGTKGFPSDAPAPGGREAGDGSAGDVIEGQSSDADTGGGGAGYIRINAAQGGANVTGTVSPSVETECATVSEF